MAGEASVAAVRLVQKVRGPGVPEPWHATTRVDSSRNPRSMAFRSPRLTRVANALRLVLMPLTMSMVARYRKTVERSVKSSRYRFLSTHLR